MREILDSIVANVSFCGKNIFTIFQKSSAPIMINACGSSIIRLNRAESILKKCAVMMFVRLEITKVFEAKSLIKLTISRLTTSGVRNEVLFWFFVAEKSVRISGVRIRIAPSFAKSALKNALKRTRNT